MSDANELTPELAAEDLTGKQLDGFRILRRLGSGAMADVYLADQPSLLRQVAVKVLKRHLAADQTYVKRFQREAQAAASLVHANIVQIFEVGASGRTYYIVQEYVQGLNLRQWLDRNGSPDLQLSLVIMRQVAAALAKAGQQGIVHRDVKPENIMLTRTGEVKVADFGLARLSQDGEQGSLTQVGMTMGTPMYMSPEQVEGRPLDPRSDIYSLGVTCYQMLAGCPPFSGDTALSIALQHIKKQPDPLENHRPDLPAALCRVVHKMLAKNPEHRFQSAWELLRELHDVQVTYLGDSWPEGLPSFNIEGLEATAIPHGAATQHLDVLMRTSSQAVLPRPRWRIWSLGGLVALLLGGILAWLTIHEKPLLADVEGTPRQIPRQKTVRGQWFFAGVVGTPEAWQSVIDYFKDDTYWVNRAKQEKARILLREEHYDEALELFQDLAANGESADLRAFGLAGQSGILTLQGEYRESAAIVEQLYPMIKDNELDPQMRDMLQFVLRTNRSKLGNPNRPEWQKWLQDHFPDAR